MNVKQISEHMENEMKRDVYDEALRNTSLRSVNVNIVNDGVEHSLFHIYAKLSIIAHYLNEGWCMSDDGHVGYCITVSYPYPYSSEFELVICKCNKLKMFGAIYFKNREDAELALATIKNEIEAREKGKVL